MTAHFVRISSTIFGIDLMYRHLVWMAQKQSRCNPSFLESSGLRLACSQAHDVSQSLSFQVSVGQLLFERFENMIWREAAILFLDLNQKTGPICCDHGDQPSFDQLDHVSLMAETIGKTRLRPHRHRLT